MASWGCCVSVYNSSGELAGRPECSRDIFTKPFGPEFAVGGATSEDEVRKSFQERRPHGYPWELFFITYKSISLFTCIHVTATSLCLGANEERPMRSGHEEFSTGVESDSQIWLKKAIVRRRLNRLSKCRIAKRDPLCTSVDRSRTLLWLAFNEGNALASFWRVPVWFFIWSSLHLVVVLSTSLLQILLLRAQMSPDTSSCLISVCFGNFRELLGWL